MTRLTTKSRKNVDDENYYFKAPKETEETPSTLFDKLLTQVLNKLGKLEDIEERIGIDLIELFDGLNRINNSIYIIHNGSIINVPVGFGDINFYNGCGAIGKGKPMYFFDLDKGQYFFEDYGNTWAFRKEDLK